MAQLSSSVIDRWPLPTVDFVRTRDGISIRRGVWPTAKPCRGLAVVMNGRTEFIEKYSETAADLNARGFDVVSWDWRGQGQSGGRPDRNPVSGHVAAFANYLADAAAAVADMMDPSRPLVLIGHSMGGHMALKAVAEGVIKPETMILSAPLVGLRRPHGIPVSILAAVARAMIAAGRGESYPPGQTDISISRGDFSTNDLTSDADRFAVQTAWLERFPEMAVGGVSWSWLWAAHQSCRQLANPSIGRLITIPVTILQAGRETLVDNAAQDALARSVLGSRLIRLDDARHEILMERDAIRDQFWAAFDAAVAPVLRQ